MKGDGTHCGTMLQTEKFAQKNNSAKFSWKLVRKCDDGRVRVKGNASFHCN